MNNFTTQNDEFYFEHLDSKDFGDEISFLKKYYKEEIEVLKKSYPPSVFNVMGGAESTTKPLPIKTLLGKEIFSINSIITSPNTVTVIHSDICLHDGNNNFKILALNFTLEGGEGAKTCFYKSRDMFPEILLTKGMSPSYNNYLISNEFDDRAKTEKGYKITDTLYLNNEPTYIVPKLYTCKKAAECEIINPTLINVDAYHKVVNLKNSYRVALSIRFTEDPWDWLSNGGEGYSHLAKNNS